MSTLKEKVLDEITTDFIVELMDEFGVPHQPYASGSECVNFQTACHGGSSYKLVYYQNTKRFYCYTNCGYLSVFDLVMNLKSCDFISALLFLAGKLGIDSSYDSTASKEPKKPLTPEELIPDVYTPPIDERGEDGLYALPTPKYYDDTIAECAHSYYNGTVMLELWESEGISKDVMKKFEIGSKLGSLGLKNHIDDDYNVIAIPCRDINGHLLGIRGRFFTTECNGSEYEPNAKYKPVCFNGSYMTFKTGSALYGLYQNQEIIRKAKKCVVFEGEKSVLKAATIYGEYPCVASYSHSIRPNQIKLLCNLGVEEIILAYDYDNTGTDLLHYLHQRKIVSEYVKCTVMYDGYAERLQEKDSPIDRGQKTFEELLTRRL